MVHPDYKSAKQAFVADNPGDAVTRINAVCWTAIASYQLWKALLPRLPQSLQRGFKLMAVEYAILFLPLVSVLTVLSDKPILLNGLLYATLLLCALLPTRSSGSEVVAKGSARFQREPSPLPRNSSDQDRVASTVTAVSSKSAPVASAHPGVSSISLERPFITVWRAHMMIMTVIAILAVDFPVFPRSFGKCETWGTSIMDLGVGSFVFALGVVSAGPLLKRVHTAIRAPNLISSMRRTLIVLFMGIVRILMVKGSDYPEHVTEYGVHWNFFFTLGLLPICGNLAERLWPKVSFTMMALGISTALLASPLQAWTIGSDRSSLIAENKEGIVSFFGYVAIYLIGYDTGMYTLPPDPYYAFRPVVKYKSAKAKIGKLVNVLLSYAATWWALFGVMHLCVSSDYAVSRRLANLAYVLWIAAFNVSFLLLYLLADIISSRPEEVQTKAVPAIFNAINKNSLVLFILANLLTGFINISIRTMYASDSAAVSILVAYTVAFTTAAWVLRNKRVKL
ncbi:Glucosaminyl phosphatidylinositol (GlcN-PI) nositol acylation protein [Cystobasidiomycetes sp. EMM_F5]